MVGGQCGALCVNNLKFSRRAKILLDKGTDRSLITNKKKYYSWKDIGSEYRSAELPAALLYSQLKKLETIQKIRKAIWEKYFNSLNKKNSKNFKILEFDKTNRSSYHIFALVFKDLKTRDKFILFMKKRNIFCHFHYYPLHKSSYGKKFKRASMINTEKLYNGLVRLPIYPSIKYSEIKSIVKQVLIFDKIN